MKDQILYKIQKDFPLTIRPFKKIAEELDMSENEVLEIIKKEKENKIIRQTSAIFDTKKLGYSSSLVAFEIKNEDIDEAVLNMGLIALPGMACETTPSNMKIC